MTEQPISVHWYRTGQAGSVEAIYWLGNTGFRVRCWPQFGTLWDRWPWYGVTDSGEVILRRDQFGLGPSSLYAAGFGTVQEAKAATLKAFAADHLEE